MADGSKKKPKRRSAFRFEIAVNGTRVCVAGSGRYGVLSLGIHWVRHDPKKRPKTKSEEYWTREECALRIGALTRGHHEAWKKVGLREGDEIAIRLLGRGSAEMPPTRLPQPKPRTAKSI